MCCRHSSRYSTNSDGRARAGRCPPGIWSGSIPRLSRTTLLWNLIGKNRSPRQATDRVGTRGHSANGHGSLDTVSDCRRTCLAVSAIRSGDTSWRKTPYGSKGSGKTCPVLAHQSPAVSPGRGTMAFTSTARSTRRRSQTRAVNPASDWATRMSFLPVFGGSKDGLGILVETGSHCGVPRTT